MDHKQEREWSLADRKTQLSEVVRTRAVTDTTIETRWKPLQYVSQSLLQIQIPTIAL